MFIHSSFFPCTKLMVWRLEDMQNYKATLLRRFQVLQTETCICLTQQIQNPMRSWWLVTWIEFLFFWLSSLASYKGRAYIHISILFVFRTNTLPFTKLPRNLIKLSLYKKNNKSNNHLELEQLSTNNATIAGPPSTTNNPLEDHQETLLHDPEDFYRSLSIWIGIILV